jgi:RNA polymerase sigma factor (sigma-70 family)
VSPEPADFDLLTQSHTRPECFGVLYERHAHAVFRYLARRTGPAPAEDLLADVFVVAFETRFRATRHETRSCLPWLYGIAGNIVRSHRRSRAAPHSANQDAYGVDWDAVDTRLDAAARRSELEHALSTLTDVDRELLLLVAWEGLSPSEAAVALGLTPTAARSRLHRARARAQAVLDQPCPTPEGVS